MKPFADISYDAQVKRLRRLAQMALLNYDLGEVQLVRLGHGENTTFRVRSCTLSPLVRQKLEQQEYYVLRIHRPGNHSLASIRYFQHLNWRYSMLQCNEFGQQCWH